MADRGRGSIVLVSSMAALQEFMIHGRRVKQPRWQQAYGRDYHFSGTNNEALALPECLLEVQEWVREEIDVRVNGLLLNWYDGTKGHYIGKHRDSIKDLVPDAPIVTLSFGETRTFRLRPWKGSGFVDVPAENGAVVVLPYDTNLAWTHEIPKTTKAVGRRVSVTLRSFM